MPRCIHCGQNVSRHEAVCPRCFHAPTDESPVETMVDNDPMTPIARFTNAAEAGYFAHELLREANIPAIVTMDESFDALSGYWSTRFVLAVADDFSERASRCLQQMIEQPEPDEMPGYDDFATEDHLQPIDGGEWMPGGADVLSVSAIEESSVNWVPIVLTLAAGSVAFWGVRAINARPQPEVAAARERNQPDVWNLLSKPDRPWVQQLERGRRELHFDAARREGVLLEDLDGDGRFERRIRVEELLPRD